MSADSTRRQQAAEIFTQVEIPPDYFTKTGLPFQPEARELVAVGRDVFGREQRLALGAARDWRAMCVAAKQDGVELLLVSAFRSVEAQKQIIRGKLEKGQEIGKILRVNAAPGYSEHHTGRAVDITVAGCAPLAEEFEKTAAYGWLVANAARFGFSQTYSRDNRRGMVFEPWHWCARPEAD